MYLFQLLQRNAVLIIPVYKKRLPRARGNRLLYECLIMSHQYMSSGIPPTPLTISTGTISK